MSREFTSEEVKQHTDKKSLYLVIHGNVYDSSQFLDEHPGGEEVIIDVAGMDASEAFEDVGHSDEAREQLETMLIGKLKVDPNAPKPTKTVQKSLDSTSGNSSANLGVMVLVVALLAAAVYKFAI